MVIVVTTEKTQLPYDEIPLMEKPVDVLYRRYDERTGQKYEIIHRYSKLKDAKEEIEYKGARWWAIEAKVDDIWMGISNFPKER